MGCYGDYEELMESIEALGMQKKKHFVRWIIKADIATRRVGEVS